MAIRKQSGFAALEIVLAIVVVITIGVIILKVSATKPSSTVTSNTPSAQPQNDRALADAEKEIDQEDLETPTSDESALDAELATF